MALHRILSTSDLPPGQARRVEVVGKTLAVFNVNGEFHAIDDTCTHDGGPLSEGTVSDGCVTCPWHGAEFDVRTGEALTPPAVENVRHYPVTASGADLAVDVE